MIDQAIWGTVDIGFNDDGLDRGLYNKIFHKAIDFNSYAFVQFSNDDPAQVPFFIDYSFDWFHVYIQIISKGPTPEERYCLLVLLLRIIRRLLLQLVDALSFVAPICCDLFQL